MKGGRLLGVAAALAAGGVAFELDRRRLLRLRDADPDWHELNTPIEGRAQDVVSADGTRIHVEIFGPEDAPAIVLIHGWLEAIELWHHQIRDLSREFRVVAYDQRGHGASAPPHEDAYTDEALADDLQAVIEGCVPPGRPCVVAGHSMGGMTIVAWAGRHPDGVGSRVAGAALVNTGMSQLHEHLTVLGARAGETLHRATIVPLLLTEMAWPARLDPLAFHTTRRVAFAPHASVGQVAFAHRMFAGTAPHVRAGFGRMFIPLDLTPSVRRLNVPSIVIGGELDRLLPIWHSEQLAAALPNVVEYAELDGVAHMSPLEAPGELTPRIGRLARACLTGTASKPRTKAKTASA